LLGASLALALAACGAADSLSGSFVDPPDRNYGDAGSSPTPVQDGGVGSVQSSGVFLVHAAAFPAFRICFEGLLDERPFPDDRLMPEANVVGVDVGSAVRIDSIPQTLGRAFLFAEFAIRDLFPPGVPGPTCDTLLSTPDTASKATELPAVQVSLASGVHVLALTGCAAGDPSGSTARCGATWSVGTGNLQLRHIPLFATPRSDRSRLPVQALELSSPLAGRGRMIRVAFGPLEAGAPDAFAGDVASGAPTPDPPAQLALDDADASVYGTAGFFVTLGAKRDGGDAGPPELIVAQSLADIQRLSNPRAVPPEWYGVASTYVLLLLGDPDPRFDDGGADPDSRRLPHVLAVPLAEPDAGPDASAR
jgi:hypothetical protein